MSSNTPTAAAATPPVAPKKASLRRTLLAVAWSFFGVRKASEYQEDIARITPLHVIAVGLSAGILFVIALALFVHWVVAKVQI